MHGETSSVYARCLANQPPVTLPPATRGQTWFTALGAALLTTTFAILAALALVIVFAVVIVMSLLTALGNACSNFPH